MLTIILTSYNRPRFVKMAIDSILKQTSDDWQLIIKDDGSDAATLKVLKAYKDKRITLHTRKTSDTERQTTTRYSVLINEELSGLDSGIIAYMCDNVEYRPELVETVLSFFDDNPAAFAGYVGHERDSWTEDGKTRLGKADYYNHWNSTPPPYRQEVFTHSVAGYLDHSQVFHRLPIEARWEEGITAVKSGDGVFFTELLKECGSIVPITQELLTLEHLIK